MIGKSYWSWGKYCGGAEYDKRCSQKWSRRDAQELGENADILRCLSERYKGSSAHEEKRAGGECGVWGTSPSHD